MMNATVATVTDRIRERSRDSRDAYLEAMHSGGGRPQGARRTALPCGNLAHGFAACAGPDKEALKGTQRANIAIVSAYNDMLSAHQPLEGFPSLLKEAAREAGAVAQFAGGVPAMCDGVCTARSSRPEKPTAHASLARVNG